MPLVPAAAKLQTAQSRAGSRSLSRLNLRFRQKSAKSLLGEDRWHDLRYHVSQHLFGTRARVPNTANDVTAMYLCVRMTSQSIRLVRFDTETLPSRYAIHLELGVSPGGET